MRGRVERGSGTDRPDHASSDSRTGRDGCGGVEIKIEAGGDVNIYNCSDAPPSPDPCGPRSECPPCAVAPGQCVPLAIGSKPKQSLRTKLDALLQNAPVPSAIGSAFFHHSRRFLAGHAPANPLEAEVFGFFHSLPSDMRSILSCSVASFDGISADERDRLFDDSISQDPSDPLDAETLATAFVRELKQRVGTEVFGDPDALDQERPGRNRFFDTSGGESFEVQLRVCKVNGLRTNEFAPALSPGDYLPAEIEQHCEPAVVNGVPQLNCQVQTGNCPGNFLEDNTCLRVPDVLAGDAVVLEGVNFISVDAKVRLAEQGGGGRREVDAFVFGDLDTPLTEVVDGETVTIRDCRVHDRITFVVPADLPPAVYSVQVAQPNVSGFPVFGDTIVSNAQFVRVTPPPTSRFRISSETLSAREETAPASFGSDEVRVRVRAWPVIASLTGLTLGNEQAFDSQEFGNMNTGDPPRSMHATLFEQHAPMDGVVMMITGFEIDSEKAYREQINSFTDAFLHYLKITLAAIGAALAGAAFWVGAKELLSLGLAHPIFLAIAAGITLVVLLTVAAWAPADLLIEDALGFTLRDLDELTSVNLPLPVIPRVVTQQGIKVDVTPLDKVPAQYRERRAYRSDDEDSIYELVLRYNRVA